MTKALEQLWLIGVSLLFYWPMPPELWHYSRFAAIPRDDIHAFMRFNKQFEESVTAIRHFKPDSLLVLLTEKECEWCYKAWDALDDASNDHNSEQRRRIALSVLQSTIGQEAFLRGEMPMPYPLHRFIEVR